MGALEAGGTKMVCSIGNENGKILRRESFPTARPEETMPKLIGFFEGQGIEALGIGGFGPLDLNPASSTFGYITTTPKLAWRNYPIMPELRDALGVPAAIDTDVNVAALAEYQLGAARSLGTCLYVTVGTGIGGGVVAEGHLQHGLVHPEWGHIPLRPHPDDPLPRGNCPYHDGCLEGLAAGPSFEARWGVSAKDLPEGHVGWQIEAYYLAQLCCTALYTISAEKIILGGGVMNKEFLFPLVREQTLAMLGGYIADDRVLGHIDWIIVPPGLGANSGVTGALLLAARAAGARS